MWSNATSALVRAVCKYLAPLQDAVGEAIVGGIDVAAGVVVELNVDEVAVEQHGYWVGGIGVETLWR